MVKCPYCHNEVTRVWRNQILSTGYQRTRKCMKCKKKFTTEEQYTGAAKIVLENKRRYRRNDSASHKDNSTTKVGIPYDNTL